MLFMMRRVDCPPPGCIHEKLGNGFPSLVQLRRNSESSLSVTTEDKADPPNLQTDVICVEPRYHDIVATGRHVDVTHRKICGTFSITDIRFPPTSARNTTPTSKSSKYGALTLNHENRYLIKFCASELLSGVEQKIADIIFSDLEALLSGESSLLTPNLTEILSLLQRKKQFTVYSDQVFSFDRVKQVKFQAQVLRYFDTEKFVQGRQDRLLTVVGGTCCICIKNLDIFF
ncbi:hypothetical protein MAR_035513 [Mya arenaria]|uniref:Uncharacterized protein n=1 Tax=Mya arenaria TaxID=6604 RepID=A0ABY7EN88_MYAAR|nr:hypothetical protein MAR_035513 [Mya arenaria]